jgi:putative peptide zinc metalloprotease protein
MPLEAGQPTPLPRLRPELALLEGAPTAAGEPTWLIHDPLQHRFFQIDKPTYLILSQWSHCRTVAELIDSLADLSDVSADENDITQLIEFVARNKLSDAVGSGTWKLLARERESRSRAPLTWLVHNYLFFRLPLWRPQRFLQASLPVVRAVVNGRALLVLAAVGVVGLYLVSRQWDAFWATLQSYFSWEGVATSVLALAFIKILHELGHAYAAVHFGCRVPTMGIAFMLMAPLLYTDVTDAWRLRDRSRRLLISGAGVMVEFAVAAASLLVWAVLPDGPLRSVSFVLATTSLVSSLLINLNPLMRFDGYYLLSDWLGIENLQDRSFEVARWKLREWLFGLAMPCPEQLPPAHRRLMISYAACVWLYRLLLFVGIALIVYHYFFKALGIILFCLEIGYFIVRPLWSELKVWYALRARISASRRSMVTATAIAALILAAAVPWSTQVEIPSVLEPEELARIYPVRPARILAVHVKPGQPVEAGSALVTLASPDLDREIDLARIRLRLVRMQHARRMADAVDREASLELESTIIALSTKIEGLQREQQELIVRSPLTGRVAEVNPDLHPDRWIGAKEMLALVVGEGRWIARGFVSESDLWRIDVGQRGTFVPEALQRPSFAVSVAEIAVGGMGQLEILDLSSTYGGRISVAADERRRLVPTASQYPVRLIVARDAGSMELICRGVAVVAGRAESLLARVWRKSVAVLLQESGF